jgi:ATP-dependent RNA helicase MSS116
VLSDWESLFLRELKGVDIPVNEELRDLIANNPIAPDSQDLVEGIRRRVHDGHDVLTGSATGAYQAFLGYYLGQMKRMGMNRKEDLVDIANDFAALAGLSEPPQMSRDLLGKMGLKGVAGINVGGGGRGGGYSADRSGSGHGSGRSSHHGHDDGRRAPRSMSGGDRRR